MLNLAAKRLDWTFIFYFSEMLKIAKLTSVLFYILKRHTGSVSTLFKLCLEVFASHNNVFLYKNRNLGKEEEDYLHKITSGQDGRETKVTQSKNNQTKFLYILYFLISFLCVWYWILVNAENSLCKTCRL